MLLFNICLLVAAVLTPPSLRWLYSTHMILLCLYQIFRKDWLGLILVLISLVSLISHNIWQERSLVYQHQDYFLDLDQGCWFTSGETVLETILVKKSGGGAVFARCHAVAEVINGRPVVPVVANPHGDYRERYAFAKGVDAVVYLYGEVAASDLYFKSLSHFPSWRFAYSIIRGDREGWSERDRWLVNHLGIAHLFVVSGLHVGFVCVLALLLSKVIWLMLPKVRTLGIWRCHLDALLVIPLAFLYAYWSGAGEPAIRAALMALIGFSLRAVCLKVSVFQVLLVSAWCMLLVWPGRVLDPSFWLSFSFVALICITLKRSVSVGRFIEMQILLSMFAVLLTLGWQVELSGLTVLVNMVLVPFVAFVWFPIAWVALLEGFLFQSTNVYELFDGALVYAYQLIEPLLVDVPTLFLISLPSLQIKLLLIVLAYYFVAWLPKRKVWLVMGCLIFAVKQSSEPSTTVRIWERASAGQSIIEWRNERGEMYYHAQDSTKIGDHVIALNVIVSDVARAAIVNDWRLAILSEQRVAEKGLLEAMSVPVIHLQPSEKLYISFAQGIWEAESSDCYQLLNVLKTVACEHAELLESVLNYSQLETGGLGVRAF